MIFTDFALIGEGLAGALGDRVGILPIITIHAITLLLGGAFVLLLLRNTTTPAETTPTDDPPEQRPTSPELAAALDVP